MKKLFSKRNNRGSGLITVLAGVSFMMILAAIIMTVSFANVQMKQVDYRSKKNFYTDERGLDDIYNGVGRDAAIAFNKAYADTLSAISNTESDENQNKYYSFFIIQFKKYLGDGFSSDSDAIKAQLNSYINTSDGEKKDIAVTNVGGIEFQGDPFTKMVIKDVVVTYTETQADTETGYQSAITTDLVVEVPYIYFFHDIDAIFDYALIGNKGIYFNGMGKERNVIGSLYAGIDSKEKNASYMGYNYTSGPVYDGINIYNGKVNFTKNTYLISKGDLNLCEAKVNIGTTDSESYTINVWAENVRTVENNPVSSGRGFALGTSYDAGKASILNSKASLYIADDLEMNERYSQVNFQGGDYYGYNYANNSAVPNPDAVYYELAEHKYINDVYDIENQHAQSSSILVNATGTKLNVSDLNTLMIAGRAYIDIKNPYDSYEKAVTNSTTLYEYKTGESLAARYNQSVYLAPTSMLKVKPNPTMETVPDIDAKDAEGYSLVWDEDGVKEFFGVKKGFVSAESPVKQVQYTFQNGGTPVTYTYYFLNFVEGKQADYLKYILTDPEVKAPDDGKDPEYAYVLRERLLNGAANADMTISVTNTKKTYSNTGFLANTDGTVLPDTLALPKVYENSTTLGKQYINLCTNLNPAMSVTLSELNDAKYADAPAGQYVYFDRITTSTKEKIGGGYQVLTMQSGTLNNDVKGIVLCKEDLTIGDGVTVEGIVIAGGKITVNGSGSIIANRAVVEKVLEEERRMLSMVNPSAVNEAFKRNLASYYFKGTSDETGKIKGYQAGIDLSDKIVSSQYTDYVYFENWRKGNLAAASDDD